MSVIQEPGSTRPGRAAGLILLGIAVIAVVLGVITLIDGDGSNPPDGAPSDSQPPTATSSSPGGGQPSPNPPPSQPQPPSPPPGTTTAAPQPPAADPRRVPLRVFNNGTISGLARQAAGEFGADGWNVVEVGNYSQEIIRTTTAYFRPGTEEEAAAHELAGRFSMQAEPRFPGIANFAPGVIVMITNDYGNPK